jgi:ParB family chromosome partitioning protein
MSTTKLPITDIFPNPNQPRKDFDPVKLEELSMSIKEYGVRQPILVTPRGSRYMIVAGERRYRASLLAGLTEMPAVIDEISDALVEELALLENIQREDLNVIEIALAYKSLIDRGWTAEQLAQKMGFKQIWRIDEKICLLNLTDENRKLVIDGTLSNAQAQEMARVDPDKQELIRRRIISGELSTYNKLRAFVDGLLMLENQDNLFVLQTITEEDRQSIDSVKTLLGTIERLVSQTSSDVLKKAAYHSSITPERIDLIINHLMKLRKVALAGEAMKTAASAA